MPSPKRNSVRISPSVLLQRHANCFHPQVAFLSVPSASRCIPSSAGPSALCFAQLPHEALAPPTRMALLRPLIRAQNRRASFASSTALPGASGAARYATVGVWFESVAQLVEHRPFKALVLGSSPSALTIRFIFIPSIHNRRLQPGKDSLIGFNGCGNTLFRLRARVYPCRKCSKINGALAPEVGFSPKPRRLPPPSNSL